MINPLMYDQYVGKTNLDNQFNLAPHCPENTWRCNAIEGESNDGGITYEMEFEFEEAPEGWDQTAAFTDETGRSPPGLDGLNEQQKAAARPIVKCYPRTSFNNMGF